MVYGYKENKCKEEIVKDIQLLFSSEEGVVAGEEGASVRLSKSIKDFGAALIIHKDTGCIVNTKIDADNFGYGLTIHWFDGGEQGTFYNNTIYKVFGLCPLNN